MIPPVGQAIKPIDSDALPARGDSPAEARGRLASPISVRGLTVSYGQKPVLRAVSFDVSRGKLVGIVGPNGAGKSTLLKAMLGLIQPDAGTVLIEGRPASQCRERVTYVPQTEAVDWDFPVTVFDVVLMGRYGRLPLWGRPQRSDREAASQALELVGMGDFRDRHIRQLSGGQQQRVFLARALCQEADILLLDEPFAGVDAATEQAIFELIERLTAGGKTMLVVNHDLSILNRFDDVMLLNERVVAYGPTDEVLTESNLRRTYGGRLTLLERAEEVLQEHRTNS